MSNPKLFISYSWTNQDHEAWVVQLAIDLRESGIDVILDKWDLKEGHDAHAFNERMVSDPEIKKVALICDKVYVDKAEGRSGSVGTETQIISPEIYSSQAQDKFVAIVKGRDEEGKAYLPIYYRSRIYIDFSDPSTESENFEKLLRWVYEQPLYKKPGLGQKPGFLSEEQRAVSLGTSSRQKRALDAVKSNRDNAGAVTTEYLTTLAEELKKFRIDTSVDPFDDKVIRNIEDFLPYRNEAIELFLSLALYRDSLETRTTIHRFFERLIPYLDRPQNVTSYREWDFDNFKFIVHELFLYALAALIRYERFESASFLMANEYYVAGRSEYGKDAMVPFEVFRQYMKSLEYRNQRLNLRHLSLRADLLEQRTKGAGIEFRYLMEADFILFMRDNLDRPNDHWRWWPETLLYIGQHSGAFEVFARSKSASYFERAKILLGVESKAALLPLLEAFKSDRQRIPRWEMTSFSPAELLGFNDISTKP
ncbi:MAG: SEFIR domain-containing protein [Gammaproteobacteria bacterium]